MPRFQKTSLSGREDDSIPLLAALPPYAMAANAWQTHIYGFQTDETAEICLANASNGYAKLTMLPEGGFLMPRARVAPSTVASRRSRSPARGGGSSGSDVSDA